jgi:quercetin dioxygenase-like cupin family protein
MKLFAIAAAVCLGLATAAAAAQAPAAVRVLMQRADATPGQEAIVGQATFEPGALSDFHTHPGVEMIVVTQGEIVFQVRGEPDRVLKAGDSVLAPRGVVHAAHNATAATTVLTNTWLIDKGQPLAPPAP